MAEKQKKVTALAVALSDVECTDRKVIDLFDQAQKSSTHSAKTILALFEVRKNNPKSFDKAFMARIEKVLPFWKNEPSVERVIKLIIAFCTFDWRVQQDRSDAVAWLDLEAYAMKLMLQLLPYTASEDKAVRLRSLQLIAGIINSMSLECELDPDLFDQLSDEILKRTSDSHAKIRAQAAAALFRLQAPADPDDPVTTEFLEMLTHDPSPDVRRAVLKNIGLSAVTKPHILARVRDVRPDVRVLTFQLIQTKLKMTHLSISERMEVLQTGFNDPCPKVKDIFFDVLQSWVLSLNNDIPQLLKHFDLQDPHYQKTLFAATKHLIQKVAQLPQYTLDTTWECLRLEGIFYLCAYCDLERENHFYSQLLQKHLKNNRHAEVDDILPSISSFCQLASDLAIHGLKGNDYMLHQLLLLAQNLDFHDEIGKPKLKTFLQEMIVNDFRLSEPTIMAALGLLFEASKSEFTQTCLEMHKKILEGKKDNIPRRLMILQGLFRWVCNPTEFSKYTETVIKPCTFDSDPEIQELAVKALGFFLVSCDPISKATENWVEALLQVLRGLKKSAFVIAAALRTIFDVSALFVKNVAKKHESDFPLEEVLLTTADLLFFSASEPSSPDVEFACYDVQTIAAQGFAKLFLFDPHYMATFHEDKLVKLMKAYFDPQLAKNFEQRQYLSTFFTMFSADNKCVCQKAAYTLRSSVDKTTQKHLDNMFNANSFLATGNSPIKPKKAVPTGKKNAASRSTKVTPAPLSPQELELQKLKGQAINSLVKSLEAELEGSPKPLKTKTALGGSSTLAGPPKRAARISAENLHLKKPSSAKKNAEKTPPTKKPEITPAGKKSEGKKSEITPTGKRMEGKKKLEITPTGKKSEGKKSEITPTGKESEGKKVETTRTAAPKKTSFSTSSKVMSETTGTLSSTTRALPSSTTRKSEILLTSDTSPKHAAPSSSSASAKKSSPAATTTAATRSKTSLSRGTSRGAQKPTENTKDLKVSTTTTEATAKPLSKRGALQPRKENQSVESTRRGTVLTKTSVSSSLSNKENNTPKRRTIARLEQELDDMLSDPEAEKKKLIQRLENELDDIL